MMVSRRKVIDYKASWLLNQVWIDIVAHINKISLSDNCQVDIIKRFAEMLVDQWEWRRRTNFDAYIVNKNKRKNRMKKKVADIKGVVKRQKRYATLAKKEGDYAIKKEHEEAKKKMPEMAHDSAREAKIAFSFAKKRKKIAQAESKKLPKSSKKGKV